MFGVCVGQQQSIFGCTKDFFEHIWDFFDRYDTRIVPLRENHKHSKRYPKIPSFGLTISYLLIEQQRLSAESVIAGANNFTWGDELYAA